MPPIFDASQSSANRTQNKIKYEVFIFIAEMPPIFGASQSSANRGFWVFLPVDVTNFWFLSFICRIFVVVSQQFILKQRKKLFFD